MKSIEQGGRINEDWSGWWLLGGPNDKGTSLAVEKNTDNRLEVFVIAPDNTIWHNWQTLPGGVPTHEEWSGWKMLGERGNKGTSLAVGINHDGRLEVFITGIANLFSPDGPKPPGGTTDIWHNQKTLSGGGLMHKDWSGWNPL